MASDLSYNELLADLIGDLSNIVSWFSTNPRNNLAGLEALGRTALCKIVSFVVHLPNWLTAF
jgi:hypothetical protein